MNAPSSHVDERYKKIPKIDLHCHLEGALRLNTLEEIARKYPDAGLPLPHNIRPLVQVQEDDDRSHVVFLSKFLTLRYFYLAPEIIERIAYETVADAAHDGCVYIELRFTPTTLARRNQYSLGEVLDWVIEGSERASKETGILVRLIPSINRHESSDLAEDLVQLSVDRIDRGIVAMDLAGNEADFPMRPFYSILRDASKSGLHLTIHAGEWGGAPNVRDAILDLGTTRIGHGVRILEDDSVVQLALERGTVFEVCPTSNYHSGIVNDLANHPIRRMLDLGLKVTLNTDDPGVSDVTLSHEFQLAHQTIGLSQDSLDQLILTAAEAAFLPESDRQLLCDRIRTGLLQQ